MPYRIALRLYTPEYYQALGQFIAAFAEIEGAMQVALWRIAKIESPVAAAVFSGVRVDDAAAKIKRIGDAENWNETRKAAWKIILDHLGLLRTLRNHILHYGAEWQNENEWISTDRTFVHLASKTKELPVTLNILDNATADLEKLSLHLFHFLFDDEMSPTAKAIVDPMLQRAWLYTPPQQHKTG